MITLSAQPIDAPALLRAFENVAADAGAIVTFSGQVRPASTLGDVQTLHLQAYSPMTERGIEQAVSIAKTRWALSHVSVVHRIGDMKPGETIVFVATASKHRRAAFEAADYLMDYLKTEAVFWKKEVSSDAAIWIEPRTEDYKDAARWREGEAS